MSKRVLGKGLDALFSGDGSGEFTANEISIDRLVVKTGQPRKSFDSEALDELAESIREHGILQPLLVRPLAGGNYELIAGERRLRAAKMAGLLTVPIVVREMEDNLAREAALVENLQRENLNPVEEALAYREMIDEYGHTQEELARRLGKSRAHVANTLRILNLPQEIMVMVAEGRLSAGHARAVMAISGEYQQIRLARKIVEQGLTVRETESIGKKRTARKTGPPLNANLRDAEQKLENFFGTKVRISTLKAGGKIEIDFHNQEELMRIMESLDLEG